MIFKTTFEINTSYIADKIKEKIENVISDSVNDEIWRIYGEHIALYFDAHEDEWNTLLQSITDELAEKLKKCEG